MLLVSDNTATDLCLRHAGGGEAVTARMRKLGIEGVRVDRPTFHLIADWRGFAVPGEDERDPAKYGELLDSVPEERAEEAERAFQDDPRDTATPRAMAALLEKIWKRQALTPASTDLLLDIMKRCRTGAGRLKGILPEGTEVAHKTGTIGETLNDAGIITLPNGAGHVIVVAFVKKSDRPDAERERAIAEAARAAHDYFLFTPE
jgi:beta-lactamase class A